MNHVGMPCIAATKIKPWMMVLLGVATWAMQWPAWCAPFTPRSDKEVIETLRDRPLSDDERAWRSLKAQVRQHPQDLDLAVRAARQAIELARRDGDPRWTGQAQGVLSAWWDQATPPPAARLLRATILQSQHMFDAALQDLDALTRSSPQDAQARLTQASVLQVQGRYDEARTSCRMLLRLGALWHGQACLLSLVSMQDPTATVAAQWPLLLRQAPPEQQAWLMVMQAEWAERTGRPKLAESLYQELLRTSPDAYAEGAYADFLLDHGRAKEVIQRLQPRQRNDGLLLRLALAYAQSSDDRLDAAVASLQARFNASHARGDVVHRREEARFTLHLLKRSDLALQLAQANWQVQKEPADARILLEAARAARQADRAQPVRDVIARLGWHDTGWGGVR